jgi:PAS domain S-box-containing protein
MDAREQRLAAELMRSAHVAMWACNRDFQIVLWNLGAEEIYGYTSEEAIGQNYLDLFVDDAEREDSLADCLKIIDYGTRFRNFLAYDHRPDGSKRYMLTNCFRITDPETGERYQAEIGIEISDLETQKEKHRTLRELGIAKREQERQRLSRERDELLMRIERIAQELGYIRDRLTHDLDAFLRANTGRKRRLVRGVYDRRVEDVQQQYDQASLELENLALRCRAASSEEELRGVSDNLGDAKQWTERLRGVVPSRRLEPRETD